MSFGWQCFLADFHRGKTQGTARSHPAPLTQPPPAKNTAQPLQPGQGDADLMRLPWQRAPLRHGPGCRGQGCSGGRGAPWLGESCPVRSLWWWGLRVFFLADINKTVECLVQLTAVKEASCVVFLTDKPGPISAKRINIY